MKYEGHTPGPWFKRGADEWTASDGRHLQFGSFIISAGSDDWSEESYYRVGSVSNVNNSEQNAANARLIADAPMLLAQRDELLTHLKSVLQTIENSEYWWMDSPYRGGFDADGIRAAIAKVEASK